MQCFWIHVGYAGRPYRVDLYHGTSSGHLAIFVNQRVMLIDFNVFDSKQFSFFIEEDLCHIRLERKNDRMYYYFDIDKQAPTEANKRRRSKARKSLKLSLLAFAILVLAAVAFSIYAQKYKKRLQERRFKKIEALIQESEVPGVVLGLPKELPGGISYLFESRDGKLLQGWHYIAEPVSKAELDFFSSASVGDSCRVRYRKNNPRINHLVFE